MSYGIIKGCFFMLTIKQRELWASYCYNHREKLVGDVRQFQQNLRYRNIDAVDCIELALALERLNSFDDFVNCVNVIFSIYEGDNND